MPPSSSVTCYEGHAPCTSVPKEGLRLSVQTLQMIPQRIAGKQLAGGMCGPIPQAEQFTRSSL